ncbi:heme oxygenase (biliverdin-producing) [Aeromicrobium sp. Leaf350]|uniref:biliverdin-producing heme oxygenase n=1 Tax=Aeromicrobium sp. Leaf350 TaxID=2876565 RepID=UPI001E438401|nr:biliverdin-producing heme oxygenase [Aeromicrobium sp. Leaf350]
MTIVSSPVQPLTPVGLSALLREGSTSEHQAAEGSSFMGELLAGRVSREGYAVYLSCLRRVYAALEGTAATLVADPVASAVIDPSLERLAAIDADLEFWGGFVEHASPATDAYVSRIQQTAGDGAAFVAHHYTRYLGDLSGGQAIGRLLARQFELDGAGVAFYAFPEIPKPKPYKDAYRERLDALPLDPGQQQAVLAEVKTVFGLNGALFAELTQQLPAWQH